MWLYKKKEIKEISQFPKDTFGFIYKVIHNPTGKIYFGRKNLYHNRKQKLSKRAIALIDGPGRKPKYKVVTKESDWQTYYEAKYLFMNEVLENPQEYLNDNILGKFYTKDLAS